MLLRSSRFAAALAAATMLSASVLSAERDDTAVTIYSSARPGAIPPEMYRPVPGVALPRGSAVPGYAMVRQERALKLATGRSTVRFTDVAAFIDPTTVSFVSLTDPATRVLEQNFQFDLVSTEKLLQKYLDRSVTVDRSIGDQASTVSGTLLAASDGLVVRSGDGTVHALRGWSGVRFGELPGGLITKPTLVWDIVAPKGGEQRTRVSYQTGGITWWADYNLVFDEGREGTGTLDVAAWVSIINQSGAAYDNARLKLIAGDVHRAEQPVYPAALAKRTLEMAEMAADAGFEEKAFFEFHLYTLGRRTSLPDNSTKQIELFDRAARVPAKKLLVYYGLQNVPYFLPDPATDRNYGVQSNRKVDVYLEFRNDKKVGLGIPLPAGRIRVSKLDEADGSLEFIGEDVIDHTPKDETVRVKLGSAFDVVGERRQMDFTIDTRGRWMEEEIEVKLRNHKEEAVEVVVKENLYRWTTWKMVSASHQFTKEDARTIHFPVKIARDAEAVVRYRVRYSW